MPWSRIIVAYQGEVLENPRSTFVGFIPFYAIIFKISRKIRQIGPYIPKINKWTTASSLEIDAPELPENIKCPQYLGKGVGSKEQQREYERKMENSEGKFKSVFFM